MALGVKGIRLFSTGAAAVLIGALSLVGSPAIAATPRPDPSATEVIAVPMTLVPHGSSAGGLHTDIVVPGTCGTAFLFLSRTKGDEEHVDFGFEDLSIHAIWVSGQVTSNNEDTGSVKYKTWSGATAFVTSWEKTANLATGSGDVHTIGTIDATGTLSDCISSPGLYENIYVY